MVCFFVCYLQAHKSFSQMTQLIKSKNNRRLDAYYMPAPVNSEGVHLLSPPPQPLTSPLLAVYFICVCTLVCSFVCVCARMCAFPRFPSP